MFLNEKNPFFCQKFIFVFCPVQVILVKKIKNIIYLERIVLLRIKIIVKGVKTFFSATLL